ncbi:MAG: hypothetical protein KF893_09895 [Caldilineaceae bacterium]|nr:hypothetical protein [Caldilineaceae bacterium]
MGGLYWVVADLEAQGLLADHHGFAQQWLCALDGCSISVPMPSIATTVRRLNGDKTLYTHSVIAPVLVALDDYVISLEPEFITPQDGGPTNSARR